MARRSPRNVDHQAAREVLTCGAAAELKAAFQAVSLSSACSLSALAIFLVTGFFELVHDLRNPSSCQSLTSGNRGSSFDLAGIELPLPFDCQLRAVCSSRSWFVM
jgi:hypothetical protein